MRAVKAVAANPGGEVSLRQRILDEAIGLVSCAGAEGITMRALASRLGYSPATIYLHFRNKEELREEVARYGYAELAKRLVPAAQVSDPWVALGEIGRRYLEFAFERPALYRQMFGDLGYARLGQERAHELAGAALTDAMEAFYARGIASGAFRPGDPADYTNAGWSMLHGFATLVLDGRMPPPRVKPQSVDDLRERLLEIWARALRP
jgi:AcrR family transcriptional regulator